VRRIKKAIPYQNYTIKLFFDTGEIRLLDFSPYLDRKPWAMLRDWMLFSHLHLEVGTLKWLSGPDFDIEVAYAQSQPLSS